MNAERHAQLVQFLEAQGLRPSPSWAAAALEPLDAALTHTSAGLSINHEKLEFLGDAVLRLAASEFLEIQAPALSVGQASALRAQLVSDRWLADLGGRIGIDRFLRIGPMAAGDETGRATLRAEACEACIGALYRIWGDLSPVQQWLSPHWLETLKLFEQDPHLHNWKSALQEWSQGAKRGLPTYLCEERSQRHGDPERFFCQVNLGETPLGEGWGGSRRQAEQAAARSALARVKPARAS
jgi:ribonuclease-3